MRNRNQERLSFLFVFAYHCIPTTQTQRPVPSREAWRHRRTLNPQGHMGSASIFILVPLIQKFYHVWGKCLHSPPLFTQQQALKGVGVCSSYYCGCLCILVCVCVCVWPGWIGRMQSNTWTILKINLRRKIYLLWFCSFTSIQGSSRSPERQF